MTKLTGCISAKEKKKFTPEVSDHLVLEVIQRKELLVENNTSRDLTFSENKRAAWFKVQNILRERHPGFNQDIEAIKSHWRYRKRKVTDAWSEVKSAGEMLAKLGGAGGTDYQIYLMLHESNLLERPGMGVTGGGMIKNEQSSTASPVSFETSLELI